MNENGQEVVRLTKTDADGIPVEGILGGEALYGTVEIPIPADYEVVSPES